MGCWKNFLLGLGFVLLLLFGIPLHIDQTAPVEENHEKQEEQFTDYLQQFNKSYNNETIYKHRFKAFQQAVAAISKLNSHRKHNLSAVYGLTKFSDMTPDEFLDRHLQPDLYDRISSDDSKESGEHTDRIYRIKRWVKLKGLPMKVDWRDKGVITEVINQKLCGACWAISVVGNMEAMYALKTGKLIRLSVQQLIDCAGYKNDGCEGGDACNLLRWMKDFNVKVQTEEEYPLHLRNEVCKANNNSFGVKVDKYACDNLVDNEDYILSTVARIGPVAVAINALSWQYYLGGVIQFHCGGTRKLLNHAVQIVGYDLTAEIPHYIMKNSWGTDFGNKGYLNVAIGKNLCGLANEVSVLTVL